MEDLKSQKETASLFNERHTIAIRVWHWLFLITLSSILCTVLLTSTLFSTRGNVKLVQDQIQQKGGTVTPVQARAVAHAYSEKLWNLHKSIGYTIAFLMLCRIIIEISHPREDKLRNKVRNALTLSFDNDEQKKDRQHYLFVKYGYLLFYLFILIMAISGIGLALEENPFFRSIRRSLSTVHSFTQYLIYLYVLIHMIGVIRADLTDNKGMVSRMINGKLS